MFDFIFVCHLGCSVSSPLQNITNRRTNFSIPRILSYFLLNTGVDSLRWYQPYFRAKVWRASAVVYINSIRFRSVITLFWTSRKDLSLYLARVSCNKSRTFCKRMDWNSMKKVFLRCNYHKINAYDYFSLITIFFGHILSRDAFRPIPCKQEYQIDYNRRYSERWWWSKVEN